MDLRRGKFYEALSQQLLGWARHEFDLDQTVKGTDGITRRAMLEEAVKSSPSPTFVAQLRNPVEFPSSIEYLWGWFLELSHTGRVYAEGGIALPLSSTEIYAWCQLNETRFFPWERRTIRLLDVAWLKTRNRRD